MFRLELAAIFAAAGLSALSCGGSAPRNGALEVWPEPSELVRQNSPSSPRRSESQTLDTEPPTGQITLSDALRAAILYNPELQAFALEVRMREAAALQKGLYPNPEFEIEVEEIGGTGDRRGVDSAVSIFRLGQDFILSGRKRKQREAGMLEARLSGWDFEVKRLEIVTQTVTAYIDVQAAKEHLELAGEFVSLAGKMRDIVAERVTAGKVAPVELTRAEVLLMQNVTNKRRAERDLALARLRLASTWGSDVDRFVDVTGALDPSFNVPSFDSLAARVDQSPYLARHRDELRFAEQSLAVEKAKAIPDLNIGVGMQHFNENGDVAATASVGIAVPLFDRNQGSIESARLQIAKITSELSAAKAKFKSDLRAAYLELLGTREISQSIDERIIPAIDQAFGTVTELYRMGKIGLVDLIDAQQTFLQTRLEQVSTRADFWRQLSIVEGLLGSAVLREERAATREKHQ